MDEILPEWQLEWKHLCIAIVLCPNSKNIALIWLKYSDELKTLTDSQSYTILQHGFEKKMNKFLLVWDKLKNCHLQENSIFISIFEYYIQLRCLCLYTKWPRVRTDIDRTDTPVEHNVGYQVKTRTHVQLFTRVFLHCGASWSEVRKLQHHLKTEGELLAWEKSTLRYLTQSQQDGLTSPRQRVSRRPDHRRGSSAVFKTIQQRKHKSEMV